MHLDNLNKGRGFGRAKPNEGPKGQHNKDRKKITCYACGKEGYMARDCRSKNKVTRQLNVIRKDSSLDDGELWNDVMLTTAKSSEDEKNPLSDEEYETPAEEEFPAAPTKHEKIARFKERNRPATPKPTELEPAQEEPRWDPVQQITPPTQEAWQQSQKEYQATRQQQDNNNWYWYDARNAHHARLSWTACLAAYCPAHYSDKQGAGWNPKTIRGYPKCKYHWFECVDDKCPKHLWDKREKKHFPGHDDPQEVIQMQTVYRTEYVDDHTYACQRQD
ncbi:uncharacterized protein SETTUDRAFT_165398 [Exserohilum turcica Et28A]|uniref:CCHC-type domain-containing protein n=1 Tax=Exserohilum turcicum (strain 28A) TaxID=671987 RepID=R0I8G6_EXST2|nr:uncharacterized protein SETTUDRAFT_165398 [Exserohilum turcica Et28A]EOA81820.1 hypothetical protein SETTUDRAFT_165398 [Exserohilum turcica Et28A]